MAGIAPYLVIIFIIIGLILRARAAYFEWKLWKYIRNNYPEKQREYGCLKRRFLNEFALIRTLYKEDDIEDPEFIRLKTVTKRAWTALLVLIGACVCIIFLGLVVLIVTRI